MHFIIQETSILNSVILLAKAFVVIIEYYSSFYLSNSFNSVYYSVFCNVTELITVYISFLACAEIKTFAVHICSLSIQKEITLDVCI